MQRCDPCGQLHSDMHHCNEKSSGFRKKKYDFRSCIMRGCQTTRVTKPGRFSIACQQDLLIIKYCFTIILLTKIRQIYCTIHFFQHQVFVQVPPCPQDYYSWVGTMYIIFRSRLHNLNQGPGWCNVTPSLRRPLKSSSPDRG